VNTLTFYFSGICNTERYEKLLYQYTSYRTRKAIIVWTGQIRAVSRPDGSGDVTGTGKQQYLPGTRKIRSGIRSPWVSSHLLYDGKEPMFKKSLI